MNAKYETWCKDRAKRYAERMELKKELHQIKYGRELQPLAFSKIFTICFSCVCLILIFFIMYATIRLNDSQILIALVGPMLSGTIALVSYDRKSMKENTEGGIQYMRLQQEHEINLAGLDMNDEDAVG